MSEKAPNPYLTPASIIIAGAFIAVGLYFSSGNDASTAAVAPTNPTAAQPTAVAENADTTKLVRPVDDTDHILGNPDAPIVVVEYSDFECPFCKRFHDSMHTIVEQNDDVAWVYRQFPLEQLHPVTARAAAVASECAAELGGNDAFWSFTDAYLERPPSATRVSDIVRDIGLNEAAFNECIESGRHDARIQADIANAIETGGRGTPWSIIITPTGKTIPINGAQPLAVVQQLINTARDQ